MLASLRIALRLLTRLPVPQPATDAFREEAVTRSLAWYPLVGLILGGLLWGLAMLLVTANTPPWLSAALLLAAWVALTGALHLDGLSDTADAWLGGLGDRERTLAIMKDPCAGPAGVVAVVLVLLLKFAALAALAAGLHPALLLAPVLARTALMALFLTTPYVRPGGMGEALAKAGRRLPHLLLAALAILPLAAFWPRPALIAGVATLVVFLWHRRRLMKRLGGATGDTAGALVEWVETAVLVALAF